MLKYASEYFSYPSFVEATIDTRPSEVPHEYTGYLSLTAYGESVDFPVSLSKNGNNTVVTFTIDDDSINDEVNDFNERIRIAYYSKTSNASQSTSIPTWVYGTWTCTTQYGTETISITEWEITDLSFGSYKTASYRYEDGYIKAKFPGEGGITTTFRVDLAGHRIEYGGGYYMHKR